MKTYDVVLNQNDSIDIDTGTMIVHVVKCDVGTAIDIYNLNGEVMSSYTIWDDDVQGDDNE